MKIRLRYNFRLGWKFKSQSIEQQEALDPGTKIDTDTEVKFTQSQIFIEARSYTVYMKDEGIM